MGDEVCRAPESVRLCRKHRLRVIERNVYGLWFGCWYCPQIYLVQGPADASVLEMQSV